MLRIIPEKKWKEGKFAMNAKELWWVCNKKIKSREDVNKQDSTTYGLNITTTKKDFRIQAINYYKKSCYKRSQKQNKSQSSLTVSLGNTEVDFGMCRWS